MKIILKEHKTDSDMIEMYHVCWDEKERLMAVFHKDCLDSDMEELPNNIAELVFYEGEIVCNLKVVKIMTNDLSPCPLCGGNLALYLTDDTNSQFCDGDPCWDGGATCDACGVGFSVGALDGRISVDIAEKTIIEMLNSRA